MKKIVIRILAGAILLLLAVYAGDYAFLRYRGQPFGTVTVTKIYAVRLKDNKIEYMGGGQPQDVSCVYSLFPHLGRTPCWYLRRHARQRVDMR
jgi:hypothetical protein